jgi:hypothetical protein
MNDAIIVALYRAGDEPADRIVCSPEKLCAFTQAYNARAGEAVVPAAMGQHLLNLRRRGEAKGGLPRLRRAYRGRFR